MNIRKTIIGQVLSETDDEAMREIDDVPSVRCYFESLVYGDLYWWQHATKVNEEYHLSGVRGSLGDWIIILKRG